MGHQPGDPRPGRLDLLDVADDRGDVADRAAALRAGRQRDLGVVVDMAGDGPAGARVAGRPARPPPLRRVDLPRRAASERGGLGLVEAGPQGAVLGLERLDAGEQAVDQGLRLGVHAAELPSLASRSKTPG
jgi:hypothetical protein